MLLGPCSLLPAFFAAFFGWLVPAFFAPRDNSGSSEFARRFDVLLPIAIGTSIVLIVLLVVYTWILSRRADLQVGEKIGAPILMLFTNGILLPLIWWFYIWREANINRLSGSGRGVVPAAKKCDRECRSSAAGPPRPARPRPLRVPASRN